MDFQTFKKLVGEIEGGKKLPGAIYLHRDALIDIDNNLASYIFSISTHLKLKKGDWNICKVARNDFRLSLLHYPTFDRYPYPALLKSHSINLLTSQCKKIDYSKSENPPILHRRETFFIHENEVTQSYAKFTIEGEAIGLYENSRSIGLQQQWEKLIKNKGYQLDTNGKLHPSTLHKEIDLETRQTTALADGNIERHKTALHRDRLSAPMFSLSTCGFLNGSYSILDYGCGNGDDVRELTAHGLDVVGWDPVFAPQAELKETDIVNLGFVLNVIEDKKERKETLIKAYGYSRKALLVSVMLGNERTISKFKPFNDGVITQRNTFQKYYEQPEIKHYIESALDGSVIALGPGQFLIFKDQVLEQLYYLNKSHTQYAWKKLSYRDKPQSTSKISKNLIQKHKPLIEDFWQTCLELARLPGNDEFENSDQIRYVTGSHQKAFDLCLGIFKGTDFEDRRNKRNEDLAVYFSLSYFSKRPTFNRMPLSFQRDIKEFFSSYNNAREYGKELLFQISDIDAIYKSCISAHKTLPASVMNDQHDFVFHKKYLNDCPSLLRVYVGCALQLYGDLESIDLIKAHIGSGKVTLMAHDDWSEDVPNMTERIKIDLRNQKIDFFDYVEPFTPLPLIDKFRYI